MGKCVIAIDVSGSMPADQGASFVLRAEEVARTLGFLTADYYAYDTEIREEVSPGFFLGCWPFKTSVGGGGTVMDCVFKRLERWAPPGPDLLIIASDLITDFPARSPWPRMTTVWLDVSGEESPPIGGEPLFGLRVVVKQASAGATPARRGA